MSEEVLYELLQCTMHTAIITRIFQ